MISVSELRAFAIKNVLACAFPLSIFSLMLLTLPLDMGRYEVLLIAGIGIQLWMIASAWETPAELFTICVFHVAGLCLEIYKVNHGSWVYPEPSITKVYGVPVFSGFMYASVASYIIQAWRRFDLKMSSWPRRWLSLVVVAAIYVNFYTGRVIGDYRWLAVLAVLAVFWRTRVEFTTLPGVRRRMPMLLAFFLIGCFVYLGENLCSRMGVYVYPHQMAVWEPVSLMKVSSWSLLVIFSVLLVYWLKEYKNEAAVSPEVRLRPSR